MDVIKKEVIKDEMKNKIIRYFWDMYKITIEEVFDNDATAYFNFIDSINLRVEIPKVATKEYLDILESYSKFKKDGLE